MPRKSLRSTRLGLARKSAVELFVCANPEPKPLVVAAKRHGTNVSCDANRPGTRIKAQSLQPQTRMRRILAEELICASGGGSDFRRQLAIQLPKFGCCARDHACV